MSTTSREQRNWSPCIYKGLGRNLDLKYVQAWVVLKIAAMKSYDITEWQSSPDDILDVVETVARAMAEAGASADEIAAALKTALGATVREGFNKSFKSSCTISFEIYVFNIQ